MAIAVKQMLISQSKYSLKAPYTMDAEYITIHNTANDATALNEAKYATGNNSSTGYHFAIDDKEVIQIQPTNRNAFACGDGRNGTGNRKSISVEICYSKSGGEKYEKAEVLAVKFVAQLLHERGWGVDRVKPHQHWSGKFCPHRVLTDKRWDALVKAIAKELASLKGVPVTKVASAVTPAPATSKGYLEKGDKGDAVKELQSLLEKAGFEVGAIDGIFGSATDKAVRAFQEKYNLAVDGLAGAGTLGKLKEVTAPKPTPKATVLQKGDKGDKVKELQTLLSKIGYEIAIDGIFGNQTMTIIKDLESQYGYEPDGIVGEVMVEKIKSVVAELEADVELLPYNVYGIVTVIADELNLRAEANLNAPVASKAKKGQAFKCYGMKNGLYMLGGAFCTSNPDYVDFEKNPNHKK